MKIAGKISLLVYLIFYSPFSFSQGNSDTTFLNNQVKMGEPFRGFVGIFVGGSGLGIDKFDVWANQVTNQRIGLKTTSFINIGIEAFGVKNRFAYGIAYMHESLFTNGSPISPNRGSVAIYGGVCPTNPYSINQLLFTVGIGYSAMNIKFHGDPPAVLQNPNIPNNLAKMTQKAFWLNPKVCLVRKIVIKDNYKFKVGLDGGLGFYFPGHFKYGYDYTYYTYSYTNGSNQRVSHTQFVGYTVYDVPNINNISFHLSGFIAF